MEISVSELKKFNNLSSHVDNPGILPIYDYIKFGSGQIQKVASNAFVRYYCQDAETPILVDEAILFKLVSNSASPTITITKENDVKTIISDGKTKISIQVPELSLFKDIQESGEKKVALSKDFAEAIGAASKVCQPMTEIPDKYMYVMVGNKSVVGISQSYGYYRPIEEDVIVVLEKSIANFLSKIPINAVSETEAHYIFYTEDAVLGFTKQEIKYGDFAKVLRGDTGDITFTCSNADIKAFNSLSLSLGKNPIVTMTKGGTLEMNDSLKDIFQVTALPGLTPYEDFSYNPINMNNVLAALYTEELDFYQKDKLFFIKENEKNAVALIGKIAK